MGLAAVILPAIPPASVHQRCHLLQMIPVHTSSIAAEVVELHASNQLATCVYERKAVGLLHSPVHPKLTVATRRAPSPLPASAGALRHL